MIDLPIVAGATIACLWIALILGEIRYRLLLRRHVRCKDTLNRIVVERDEARWHLTRPVMTRASFDVGAFAQRPAE